MKSKAENKGQSKQTRRSDKYVEDREPQWSNLQKDIFDWVKTGTGNLRIAAVAGSGKTTCLTAIAARIHPDSQGWIFAFNKHIVENLNGCDENGINKLPKDRIKAGTAHGMGRSLLIACFKKEGDYPEIDVKDGKYRTIIKPYIEKLDAGRFVASEDSILKDLAIYEGLLLPLNEEQEKRLRLLAKQERRRRISKVRRQWIEFAIKLVGGCQCTLIDPSVPEMNKLIGYYNIEQPIGADLVIEVIESILRDGEEMARRTRVIDCGDMLWLPHKWDLPASSSKDWIFVDEVQDANRAQLSLYEKYGRNGRVIVVGDQDQAIQGFAFSSPAMWNEIGDRFQCKTLPLSVCYRCPTSHLDLARCLVPSIQHAPNAKTGDISVIHPNKVAEIVEKGDLILCRFTAPLIDLFFGLLKRGIPSKVRGQDMGEKLARLADIGERDWVDFVDVIDRTMGGKIAELRLENEDGKADSIQDDLSCLKLMHLHFSAGCNSIAEFIEKIKSVFSDDEEFPVILSTIHRSKGDESNRVFILACNTLPYGNADMLAWQIQQERNIAYVALTRAKQSLVFVPVGRGDGPLEIEIETKRLLKLPYGGMRVSPVLLDSVDDADDDAITPYQIGDRFSFLGCGPHVITSVIRSGITIEYTADYVGPEGDSYWKCESYGHGLVSHINTLN